MTPGTDGSALTTPASPVQLPPTSRWDELRSALALALTAPPRAEDQGGFNLHAVLNLLNRLNGTREEQTREDLISRLADYLTALYRVQSSADATLSALCEMTRSYAAMRYFMADAIEPRLDFIGHDLALRSLQAAGMAGFLQRAVDSLLDHYIPRVEISVLPRAGNRIELGLSIERPPGTGSEPPPGWTALAGGTRFTRTARFVALARPLPRA